MHDTYLLTNLLVGGLYSEDVGGPVVSIDAQQSLDDAITSLRSNHIDRLLVIDALTGNPLYLLSYQPILRFLRQCVSITLTYSHYNHSMTVSEYISSGVVTVLNFSFRQISFPFWRKTTVLVQLVLHQKCDLLHFLCSEIVHSLFYQSWLGLELMLN